MDNKDWIKLKTKKPGDGETCCLAWVENGKKQYVMSRYKQLAPGGPGYFEHPTQPGMALDVSRTVKYYFALPEFPEDA